MPNDLSNSATSTHGLQVGSPLVWRLALAFAVAAAELALLSLAYQHNFEFECRARAPAWFCGGLSAGVLRTMVVVSALALVFAARPAARATFRLRLAIDWRWAVVHLAGVVAIMAPWLFLSDASSPFGFAVAICLWLLGLVAAASGAALALAPINSWLGSARALGRLAIPVLGVAFLAPEIAAVAQWAWKWPMVAVITFEATAGLLAALGQDVIANPAAVELGIGDFVVLVGRQCSGVEGFALIVGFLVVYLVMFRDRVKFPRALILFPIGILASWCLNVVRISALILIGAYISPDLAINGFHSHAGWLMFTLLSVGLATAAHSVGWLRADMVETSQAAPQTTPTTTMMTPEQAPSSAKPPFFADPIVAQILPFAIFMASALLASTFLQTPTVVYPLRALAMIVVLALVWRPLLAMDWRIHWTAPAAGLAIGLAWIATAPGPGEADLVLQAALGDLAAPAFALWIAARIVGTTLLVPLIEELFFRGYLLDRLNLGGRLGLIAAVVVSTGLFAVLHDRWVAGVLAGLIFALMALRRGRLSDAIVAHAVANGAIALHAVMAGDWHVI